MPCGLIGCYDLSISGRNKSFNVRTLLFCWWLLKGVPLRSSALRPGYTWYCLFCTAPIVVFEDIGTTYSCLPCPPFSMEKSKSTMSVFPTSCYFLLPDLEAIKMPIFQPLNLMFQKLIKLLFKSFNFSQFKKQIQFSCLELYHTVIPLHFRHYIEYSSWLMETVKICKVYIYDNFFYHDQW